MMRFPSRSPLPARLPLALGLTVPTLLALTLVSPVGAQTRGGVPAPDPWHGIVVVVTPPADDDSPYETAQDAASDSSAGPVAAAPEDDGYVPSLWTVLTLGLGGDTPEPSSEKKAPNQLISAPKPVVRKTTSLPTKVEVNNGPASLAITTSASGSAPSSGALGTEAGGTSGEIKGRLGVEQDNLTVYSTGKLGASASTGTPTLSDNLAIGSAYSVPLAPLGLGEQKLGANVEVDNSRNVTTGLELRAPLGTYERFLAIERSAPADSSPSGVVKAGVLGRF